MLPNSHPETPAVVHVGEMPRANATTVSEGASETPAKRLGRPPAFDPGWLQTVAALFPEIKTARGLQNRAYAVRAIGLLTGVAGCERLVPPEADVMAGRATLWFEPLTELGRLTDHRTVVSVARLVDQQMAADPDMTAGLAAEIVRQYRRRGKA